jgi:hypothetical protein
VGIRRVDIADFGCHRACKGRRRDWRKERKNEENTAVVKNKQRRKYESYSKNSTYTHKHE